MSNDEKAVSEIMAKIIEYKAMLADWHRQASEDIILADKCGDDHGRVKRIGEADGYNAAYFGLKDYFPELFED